jgi:hypothetical protein
VTLGPLLLIQTGKVAPSGTVDSLQLISRPAAFYGVKAGAGAEFMSVATPTKIIISFS